MPVALAVVALVLTAVGASACSEDDDFRYATDGIGLSCGADADCPTAFCCKSPPCGHGSCSYRCSNDYDCPPGTACEGGACFYTCRSDYDCWMGQRCKTPKSVCQY